MATTKKGRKQCDDWLSPPPCCSRCTRAPQAADQVKLGFITPLSGPISPAGTETKRGVDLALEELGNKLGGLPVRYTVVDDKTNPAEAVQGASKLIDDAKVDFVTGFSASNTMIPIWKTFIDAGIFAVGALAGPLQFAGKECLPNGFVDFVLERRLAGRGRQVHERQGRQERVLPRRRLSGRLRARRRRHPLLQGQGHRPGLHAAEPARLRARDRPHPRREARRGVRLPGRRRRRRLQQAVRAGRPAGADSVLHRRPGGEPADLPGARRRRARHHHGHQLDHGSRQRGEQEVRRLVHGEAQARARHLRGARATTRSS